MVIGSFFLHKSEVFGDFRSFERAIKAITFFDKHIGREAARITHAAVVNRLFDAQERLAPNLDIFFCSNKVTEIDVDRKVAEIELLIEANCVDSKSDWFSVFEPRAKTPLPEIEKFPVYFYEEGTSSLETTLRIRELLAFEHWKGNIDYTLYDILKTIIPVS